MSSYQLRRVRRAVGDFCLRIDDCRLESGRIYAVAGPNGCGKSTFLGLLAMIDGPQEGRIIFDGEPVDHKNPRRLLELRRGIAYLMQNPYLFNTSVYENIAYGLKVRRLPAAEIRKRVERAMETLGVAHLSRRNAHELSGGEVQRVALARTLILETEVFLLDEPTANVDQANVRRFEELIRQVHAERKATIVLSTHSRDQAYRLSQNPISIVDGRITDIGYENVFCGELRSEQDGLKTIVVAGKVVLKVAAGKTGPATIAVDPQDIILSRDRIRLSALNALAGPIIKIEDVSGSLRVFVDTGIVLCALITRRAFLAMDLNIGQRVWATFKAAAVRVV